MDNTEYITVRQYSAAANISAQAVYQRLDKDLKPYVKIINGRKMLSAEVLKNLDTTCQEVNQVVDKHLTSEENNEIQHLQQEIQELKQQLLDKEEQVKTLEIDKHELELDKQLTTTALKSQISSLESIAENLNKQNDILNSRLDKAEAERERLEQTISNLTIALSAAQALHGIDKQQAAIEVKADDAAAPESEPSGEIAPEEDQDKKLSFFARLFKRK